MKLGLRTLERFGFGGDDFARLRDGDAAKGVKTSFTGDAGGYVDLSSLQRRAALLDLQLPAQLLRATQRVDTTTPLPKAEYPSLSTSVGEAREHPARPGDPEIPFDELKKFTGLLDFLRPKPEDGDGITATKLLERLRKGYAGTRMAMTSAMVERATVFAASAAGPAHTERDATVHLDSTFTPLAEGKNGAKLYRRNGWADLFPRRGKAGDTIELHGFQKDSVVVTVPSGARVFITNEAGDQCAAQLSPRPMKIDGQMVQAVEITPSMVRRSGSTIADGGSFAVKVFQGDEPEPAIEASYRFPKNPDMYSKKLWSAPLAYQANADVDAVHFDHYVPSARDNAVPVGQRPRVTVDGEDVDRVKITRDHETFTVDRLLQLLEPGGPQIYASTLDDGKKQTLTLSRRAGKNLDDPQYDPTEIARLRNSWGHPATFDPTLSGTNFAQVGSGGLTIYAAGTRNPIARFDPLTKPKH
ncbi:MAG: hypothetical protein RMA76_06690 [Deltaproteobacteria bacterium]